MNEELDQNPIPQKNASGEKTTKWLSMPQAVEGTSYSAEYLSLLARRNKLFARKIGGVWHTTKFAVKDYVKSQKSIRKTLNQNLTPAFEGGLSSVSQAFEDWKQKDLLARRRPSKEPKSFTNLSLHLGEFEVEENKIPLRSSNFLKHGVAVLTLLTLVISGNVLFKNIAGTSLEMAIRNQASSLEASHELAASLLGFLGDSVGFFALGFTELKELALRGLYLATNTEPRVIVKTPVVKTPTTNNPLPTTSIQTAIIQTTPSLDYASLRADLKSELENYVRTQLSSTSPVNIYQNYYNPILREEILLADTRPTVTRQSTSDVTSFGSVVAHILDGGNFTNASISGSINGSISGTGDFSDLTFSNATGTNATTTHLFSTTASSTNLFSTLATFGSATSSTFAIAGDGAGLTFYGTGSHDISAQSGTLRIGSNTIIGNIQALDDTVDIGTAGVRFDKIYANEVNASTLVGTLTGGNLTAETFSINSDNATADTEDSFLAFERGSLSPNALLRWNSTADNFEFNNPLLVHGSTTLQNFSAQYASTTQIGSTGQAYFATSGGNVGIGTTNPSLNKLVVSGASGVTDKGITITDENNLSAVDIMGGNGRGYIGLNNAGTRNILFNSFTGVANYINNGGNVGIGTTSPNGPLNVVVPNRPIGSGTADSFILSSGLMELRAGVSDTDNYAWIQSTERDTAHRNLILNGLNGNVGIGTTSPLAKLSVAGDSYLGGNVTATGTVNVYGNFMTLGSSTFQNFSAQYASTTQIGSTGQAYFATSGGNVGIGTTNPGKKLDIYATNGEVIRTFNTSNSDLQIISLGSSGNNGLISAFDFNGTEQLHLTASGISYLNGGSVAIGTTVPSERLHVVGGDAYFDGGVTAIRIRNNSDTRYRSDFSMNGSTGTTINAYDDTGGVYLPFTFQASTFSVQTSSGGATQGLYQNANGNVGIGTTTPLARLDVDNTTAYTATTIAEVNNANFAFRIKGRASNNEVLGIGTMGANSNEGLQAYDYITNGSAPFLLNPFGGNVGIGTVTPTNTLAVRAAQASINVNSSTGTNAAWTGYDNTGGTLYVGKDSSTGGSLISGTSAYASVIGSYNDTHPLQFAVNNAVAMTILNGGNVGIGTTGPGFKLDIADATANGRGINISQTGATGTNYGGVFQVSGAATSNTASYFGASGATTNYGVYIVNPLVGANNWALYSPSTAQSYFNGNVGIGDTTPDALLDVKGTVCLDLNADEACTDNTAAISDARLKTNVTNITNGLALTKQLRPVRFTWNGLYNTGNADSLGFLAQEVEAIFPELVITDTAGYKNLDYGKLTSILAGAIQEVAQITGVFKDTLIAWLADATNGIGDFFANRVHTKELCVGDTSGAETCITKSQLDNLIATADTTASYNVATSGGTTGTAGGVTTTENTVSSTTSTLDSSATTSPVVSETSTQTGVETVPADTSGSVTTTTDTNSSTTVTEVLPTN